MDAALRQEMGQRFRYDFSHVRVHFGTDAEQSAREVNADAYTIGHHLVFGRGRFAPATQSGRRLLAHELTHVVQQSDRGGAAFDRQDIRGVSPVSCGSWSREQDRGRHLESEANAVGAAVDKGDQLPAISAGVARGLFRSPETPDDSEKRRMAEAAESNRPISTAPYSTEGFDLNLAQRGFDFVSNLRSAIARNKLRISDLERLSAVAPTSAERNKLSAEIARLKDATKRNEDKLRLVSTPQLKNSETLDKERMELTNQLGKELSPAKRAQTQKKLAEINQQINAVEFAKANPGEAASLSAYEGTSLGSAKLHTYVTAEVTLADGEMFLFQARNVPGADHAEDVVMKQMEAVGLTKEGRLAGARIVFFGDQEVCARCQKRVPKFGETHGVHEIEGYTTHGPALTRDASIDKDKTVGAKTTSVGSSNPADVAKRENAQRASGTIGEGEKLQTVQKRTYYWKNPAPPPVARNLPGGEAMQLPPSSKPQPASTPSLQTAAPVKSALSEGLVAPSTPKPAVSPRTSAAIGPAESQPVFPAQKAPTLTRSPSTSANTGALAEGAGTKQKLTITVPSRPPPEALGPSAKGEAIGGGILLVLDGIHALLDHFADKKQRAAAEEGWAREWPRIQEEITKTGKGVVVYFEYTRYGDSTVLVYEGIHWSSGGYDPGQPAAIRESGQHASFSRVYVRPTQGQASITDETALEFRRTELFDTQRVYQESAERMSKEGWVGRKLRGRAGSHLDPKLTYDAKAHLVSARQAIKQKRFTDAARSLDLAEKALDEMREQFKAYMGPGQLD
jgi:hypothetical protein